MSHPYDFKLRIFGEEWRRWPESNRRIEDLQSPALPLGYRARAPKHLLSIDFAPSSKQKPVTYCYMRFLILFYLSFTLWFHARTEPTECYHCHGRRYGLVRHRLLWQRIETPNLDRLARNGLRFTQFYNTGRCCPTGLVCQLELIPIKRESGT